MHFKVDVFYYIDKDEVSLNSRFIMRNMLLVIDYLRRNCVAELISPRIKVSAAFDE